ncbi:MAG: M48 family metalloprotease [Armatimonadota bacterium]
MPFLLRLTQVAALALTGAALPCLAQTEPEKRHQEELKRDVELGQKYAAEIEKQVTLSEDASLLERVNRIGQELAVISREHHVVATYGDKRHNVFEYTFKVVQDEDVNAFSIPGGFIYINSGLLDFVQSDDELAAVLAHEIAHAANRHLITMSRQQERTQIFTLPVVIAALLAGSVRDANLALIGQDLLLTALTSGWSQEAETDADRAAVYYMLQSKYNPVGLLTFMERLAFREKNSPRFDWGIMRTHPPSRLRAERLKGLLKKEDVPIERSKVTTDFRVAYKVVESGVIVTLGNEELFRLGGEGAEERAKQVIEPLNEFFDSVPQVFELSASGDRILARGKTIIRFEDSDATGGAYAAAAAAEASLKRAVYRIAFRINW